MKKKILFGTFMVAAISVLTFGECTEETNTSAPIEINLIKDDGTLRAGLIPPITITPPNKNKRDSDKSTYFTKC